jgi:hypothetical protein
MRERKRETEEATVIVSDRALFKSMLNDDALGVLAYVWSRVLARHTKT